jgi:hypothetical protein
MYRYNGSLRPLLFLAAELADRLAILVAVRRFPGMGVADSRSLRSVINASMQHSVRRTTYVSLLRFFFWGGGCAARVHATSFCCSSWYFGFLSPRRIAGGQC